MQHKRLTTMNQYGDVLYCGPRNTNSYRNLGLYTEDMTKEQIDLVLYKLYDLEEIIEDLEDKLLTREKIMEIYNYANK